MEGQSIGSSRAPPIPPRTVPPRQQQLDNFSEVPESKIPDAPSEIDCDDEISAQMTASYSEISFNSGQSPVDLSPLCSEILNSAVQRPATLQYGRNIGPSRLTCPLDLEGTVRVEGNMTHFVAEDLEYKIKLSSPVTKKGDTPPFPSSRISTPSSLYRQLLAPQMAQVNSDILNELEVEAQHMATSIDNLTENLCGILHSISAITADNVDTCKDAVNKMTDAMDSNIKSMYTIVAKAEEVTQAMKPVQAHAARIKEIKRLVDLFESNL